MIEKGRKNGKILRICIYWRNQFLTALSLCLSLPFFPHWFTDLIPLPAPLYTSSLHGLSLHLPRPTDSMRPHSFSWTAWGPFSIAFAFALSKLLQVTCLTESVYICVHTSAANSWQSAIKTARDNHSCINVDIDAWIQSF